MYTEAATKAWAVRNWGWNDMATIILEKIKQANGKSYALVDASDVEMPDGSRLSELSVSYPIEDGVTELQPETYYVFGEVDSLSVTLSPADDGKVHEYCFEFTASENFTELTVSPEIVWVTDLQQIAEGKTCQVSILRGIGVMACA